MDIKVGDIINISGIRQRVTKMGQYYITLSYSGVFALDEIKQHLNIFTDSASLEPVTLPQFDIGDLVFVNDIKNHEKSRYSVMWGPEKDKYVGKVWPVTNIRDTEFGGSLVTLDDDQDFQIYHLEKVTYYNTDYDIV